MRVGGDVVLKNSDVELVRFTYWEKWKSLWRKNGQITLDSGTYVVTAKTIVLVQLLLIIPIILVALLHVKIIPGISYGLNFTIILLSWAVVLIFILPLFARYKCIQMRVSFGRLLLEKSTALTVVIPFALGQYVRYYEKPHFQDRGLVLLSTYISIGAAIWIIVTIAGYFRQKRKSGT